MKRSRIMICLIAVISLLASVIWHSPASAATVPTLEPLGQIGVGRTVPSAIDVDGQGNIFVADPVAQAVVEFDQYGTQRGTFLDGQVTGRGVAVSQDGQRLYAATADKVLVVNPVSGAQLGELAGSAAAGEAEFINPGEIDLDARGFVFVVDNGRQQVKVFDAAGAFQYAFGGPGSADGQFWSMVALAVNPQAGEVYVADGQLERIQVFDLAGTLKQVLPRATAFGPTPLLIPSGMAFDAAGRGYFMDFGQAGFRVLDSTRAYLSTVASPVNSIKDAAYDAANGRLLVASDMCKVAVFGVDGGQSPVKANHLPSVPQPLSPAAAGVVTSASPALQFAAASDVDGDALSYQVQVLDAAQTVVAAVDGATVTTVTVPVALAENGAFAWQVRAFDGQDYSAWSAPAEFQVNAVPEAPTAPALVAPLAGEVLGGDGLLSWSAASDPDPAESAQLTYQVAVTLPGSSDPVMQAELAGLDIALGGFADYTALVPGQAYAWTVTAVDPGGLVTGAQAAGAFVYQPNLLTVTANMPQAKVYLGGNPGYSGQLLGTAPVEVRDLAAGTYPVVVECPGFETFFAVATVAEQGSAAVSAQLAPARTSASALVAAPLQAGSKLAAVAGGAFPALVDFDDDGSLDLLAGDGAGTLRLFAGSGAGFGPGADLGLILAPGAAPAVADWNNDNRKDLLVGAFDGTVSLFLNLGSDASPRFDGGTPLVVAGGTTLAVDGQAVPAVADFDGDGDKDLVVGSGAGQLVLFRNVGSDSAPELAAGIVLGQLAGPVAPFSMDWDSDGNRDLMAATASGLVKLGLLQDGSWGAVETIPAGIGVPLAAAGCDLDGKPGKDLVVGLPNGSLELASVEGIDLVAAFPAALAEKVRQVADGCAETAPAQATQLQAIAADLESGAVSLVRADQKLRSCLGGMAATAASGELLQILDAATASTAAGTGSALPGSGMGGKDAGGTGGGMARPGAGAMSPR